MMRKKVIEETMATWHGGGHVCHTQGKHVMETLDVNDLSRILKIKPRSLHARLVRRPESLPRPIQRGNGKKLLWLERDVVAWMTNEGDSK
jgi:hypothetical protein